MNGYLSGDRGLNLWVTIGAGAGTGALAGLTGGASLLEQGGLIAARSVISAGIESDRQLINRAIDPASEINTNNIVLAGGLSVFGDAVGSAVSLQKAIQEMQSLRIIAEANENVAAFWGANAAGIVQIPFSVLDGLKPKVEGPANISAHGGGATVGGLPGRIAVPAATYSGNQK
ncbi:MAG: hypothetical protein HY016_02450 [Nitrosomonadales bacterium]|nr:hypothetical protein [Nitrosomonadales bacterium]